MQPAHKRTTHHGDSSLHGHTHAHRTTPSRKTNIGGAANDLLSEGKKFSNALYKGGKKKMSMAEKQMKEYSDELLKKVQHNPLSSILIAGGVGFFLSMLLKK